MTRSRRVAVVGACALSGATALWLNAEAHPPVTDAARAPGLLELAASLAAAARPGASLATMLTIWQRIAVVAAAGLSTLAVWRFTQSLMAAVAIGLVAAASTVMAPALSPPDATALVVAAATACAMLGRGIISVAAGLLISSSIAPALILPNAVLCLWCVRRSTGRANALGAFGAAALLIVISAAVTLAIPALPGQPITAALAASLRGPVSVSGSLSLIAGTIAGAGPLALAIAAFGAFAVVSGRRVERQPSDHPRMTLVFGVPAAACIAAFFPGVEPVRALAPLLLGLWLLMGFGLAEMQSRSGGRWRGAGAIAIAAILVAIHIAPRINPPPSAAGNPAPLGHEELTRRNFQELLYQVPPDSALVAEDALTAVLLRSLSGSLERSRNGITILPRTPEDVAVAKTSRRVFALPRAQSALQERGVRFIDNIATPQPGIAEVAAVVSCEPLSTSWRMIAPAAGATRLTMVANNDEARGPIVVYTGGPAAIETAAIDWPPLAMRGFYTRAYDRSQPDRRQGLADEVATDEAPAADAAVNTAHVARTELWRVPGAPRALTFALSAPATSVMAVQLARGTGPIQLCPAFPFAVRAFAFSGGR